MAALPRLRGSRQLRIPVRCFTTNMEFCRGRLRVKARAVRWGCVANRLVQVATDTYELRAGQRTVRVRIGNRARRRVLHRGMPVRVIGTFAPGQRQFPSVNAGRRLRR